MIRNQKPLQGLNGSNRTLQLWEVQQHMRRHSTMVQQARPSKEVTEVLTPFRMKKQEHNKELQDMELQKNNEKLLRKIRDLHLDQTLDSQPASSNPKDKARWEEHDRILNLKAKVHEINERKKMNDAQLMTAMLHDKMLHVSSSYDTTKFSMEYTKRKEQALAISRAKLNTAVHLLGNTLGGCAGAKQLHKKSKSGVFNNLARSCPDFNTNIVGTFAFGETLEVSDILDDEILNGNVVPEFAPPDRSDLTKRNRPKSAPFIRGPKKSKEPKLKSPLRNKKGSKFIGPKGVGVSPDSNELLRSLTEERLKDIDRIERVLRGMKESADSNVADVQSGVSKQPSSFKNGNISDISDLDDLPAAISKTSSDPCDNEKNSSQKASDCLLNNPLMKLKMKFQRIRKITEYLKLLQESLMEDEKETEDSDRGGGRARQNSERCLLPNAVWNIKLKQQRIRKINNYLFCLQNSFNVENTGDADNRLTKEELEELDRILRDDVILTEDDTGVDQFVPPGKPSNVTTAQSLSGGRDSVSKDLEPISHLSISYGQNVLLNALNYSHDHHEEPADSSNFIYGNVVQHDCHYTEFGLPADVSLLAPHRDDNSFVTCHDTCSVNANGSLPRDIYKIGIPRRFKLMECDIECKAKLGTVQSEYPEDQIFKRLHSIAEKSFKLRISDIGLSFPRNVLPVTKKSKMGGRVNYQTNTLDSVVHTSTGILIELLGPAEFSTLLGESKIPPWQEHLGKRSESSSPSKQMLKANRIDESSSPIKGNAALAGSKPDDIQEEIVVEPPLIVLSRHFLSIPQLHSLSGRGFSSTLHSKLGRLNVVDANANITTGEYGFEGLSIPGILYECLSDILDTMGKGLLLEMVLSNFEATVTPLDPIRDQWNGIGNVHYVYSNSTHTDGIAIINTDPSSSNVLDRIHVVVYLEFS